MDRPGRPCSEDEAAMFMCKAMAIREFLLDWNARRAASEKSHYLSTDSFTPWVVSHPYATDAWLPHAGEAHIGDRLRPDLLVEADGVPVVKRRGRPKNLS